MPCRNHPLTELSGMSAENVADRLSPLSEEVADLAMTELRAAMERGETKPSDLRRISCLGRLLPILNLMAFTGELKLRYLAPCPLGVPLQFRAWLVDSDGRKLMIKATGEGLDGMFVEADAVFITVSVSDLPPAEE